MWANKLLHIGAGILDIAFVTILLFGAYNSFNIPTMHDAGYAFLGLSIFPIRLIYYDAKAILDDKK